MNWFACSKKFKEKNWCNNFDYNDRQCKNSVITKQCNSSARWQKQTNKQFGDHQEKQIVLEKVTFSEKFRAGFMIFQYSMKMEKKNTLHPNKSFKNTTKKKNGQKVAKNGL